MTAETQRAVAYLRESTEEQGQGFSPDAQRQAIKRFAQENELALINEYCDFHSGWRKSEGHPGVQRLMADAAESRFEVVLVYHTSRFARNQIEARRYKQLLRERLGIRVISVTQPMGEDHTDPSAPPPTGLAIPRDVRRVLLGLAVLLDPLGAQGEGPPRPPRRLPPLGATPGTPKPSSQHHTPSAPHSSRRCSSATPPDKSQTAPSPPG